jgi:hypothetical protein
VSRNGPEVYASEIATLPLALSTRSSRDVSVLEAVSDCFGDRPEARDQDDEKSDRASG